MWIPASKDDRQVRWGHLETLKGYKLDFLVSESQSLAVGLHPSHDLPRLLARLSLHAVEARTDSNVHQVPPFRMNGVLLEIQQPAPFGDDQKRMELPTSETQLAELDSHGIQQCAFLDWVLGAER